ncbi:hypothetical protein CHS0354_002228 [Potamilus streckersoni]|uniref:Uncharacterized protein n=1 Tax=Potamilus streckersoni TaxID=2493646 RepID=A0AAE0TCA9_9BIVA|nr:hypothetical protein CHS0354_002228 [Potamilus streckersoni]
MPGHTVSFPHKLRKRCYCLLCHLPMRDPVKVTTCGHRFCDLCLQEYLSAGVFKCPEDDKPLDYAKIYPDPDVQSEIMNSLIRCKYYKEGCRWVDKLQNLQPHLDACRFDSIQCPNHCTACLSHLSLDDHLEFTCPRRIVICEFCNQEFPADQMELQHAGNCQYEIVWCENKCGAKLERRFLDNHMRNECHKRTITCQYCLREFVHETLQAHLYQCPRFPVLCPNRCDPSKIPREEVDLHVQELCPSATVSCAFKHAGCKHKPIPPTRYCDDATDCGYGKCCVTKDQVRGKRDTTPQGTCQRLGTRGSRCLASYPQPLSSGMYYICPCATGFSCLGTGLYEIPLGEIAVPNWTTIQPHFRDEANFTCICQR